MLAYIDHLAQVNDIQPVLVKADITSVDGHVLAAQGTQVDANIARKLAATELAAPIEQSLELEEGFDAEIIYQLFQEFITSDPYFEEIFQLRDIDDKLVQCIEAFSSYDALSQRLNVLAIQIPDVFDQALFCSLMSVTILAHENYPQKKLDDAFIAALSHDFGLLDIAPDILFKETRLTSSEWESLQQHPQLSYDFLKRHTSLSSEATTAVIEHHENIDGTGYPKGKFERQLGELGQMLHVLDSANAIYRKQLKPRQRSLNDMIPILQMNTLSRGGHFVEVLTSLFNRTSATKHTTLNNTLVPAVTKLVKENAREIGEFIDITNRFTKEVGSKHQDIKVLTVQNTARLIKVTLTSCGIINEAYMRWLDQVEKEQLEFAYREIEDVLLMTEEIKFHITRCDRLIASYLSNKLSSPLYGNMQALQASINRIDRYQPNAELREFLQTGKVG